MENIACILDPLSSKMKLVVPERLKYAKVYIYNQSDEEESDEYQNEVSKFCGGLDERTLQELTVLRNMSLFCFKVKEI